jgi:hypothetical protein
LIGGGIAFHVEGQYSFQNMADTVFYAKKGVVTKRVGIPVNIFPVNIDSLDNWWFMDANKVWVSNGQSSDTIKAAALPGGKILQLAVKRDASAAAVRCDSGTAFIKPNFSAVNVKIGLLAIVRQPPDAVKYFSLNGRRLSSAVLANRLVIRSVGQKTRAYINLQSH